MHNILSQEAYEEPSASTTYEEIIKKVRLDLERKYGIVSHVGSYVTSVPKDKIDEVRDGIENSKSNDREVIEPEPSEDNNREAIESENSEENDRENQVEEQQNISKPKRKATGRKSRVAIAPNSIIHRIKRNFGRKKIRDDDNRLNLRNNMAKITNRMKAHVITLPIILRGKVINGINRYSVSKAKKNINKQVSEINRLKKVIDKKKKYNEYQQEKIEDRNRRKAEKYKNSKYVTNEEEREEIERQERIALMEKVNKRDEKERIAQAKGDFKYALKQQSREQKLQDKEEKKQEKERIKAEKAEEREKLKERQRKLKEEQKREISDMLKELKEQQNKEAERLRRELDRLNGIIEDNNDTIIELEQQEDEVKGRRSR